MERDRIQQIRDRWQHSASGDDLPEQDQLIDAEEMLLIGIPRPMRDFLLHLSDLQPTGWELVTCHDPYLYSYLPEVTAQAWDEGLPRHLLPLALNRTRYAAMDESGELHIWSRQFGETVDQFDCLETWAQCDWQ